MVVYSSLGAISRLCSVIWLFLGALYSTSVCRKVKRKLQKLSPL